MKSVTLHVEGMSCNHCVKTIQNTLKSLNILGKVDLENKTVQVDFDENELNPELIRQAIATKGYAVR
jgi:copper chaperone